MQYARVSPRFVCYFDESTIDQVELCRVSIFTSIFLCYHGGPERVNDCEAPGSSTYVCPVSLATITKERLGLIVVTERNTVTQYFEWRTIWRLGWVVGCGALILAWVGLPGGVGISLQNVPGFQRGVVQRHMASGINGFHLSVINPVRGHEPDPEMMVSLIVSVVELVAEASDVIAVGVQRQLAANNTLLRDGIVKQNRE